MVFDSFNGSGKHLYKVNLYFRCFFGTGTPPTVSTNLNIFKICLCPNFIKIKPKGTDLAALKVCNLSARMHGHHWKGNTRST